MGNGLYRLYSVRFFELRYWISRPPSGPVSEVSMRRECAKCVKGKQRVSADLSNLLDRDNAEGLYFLGEGGSVCVSLKAHNHHSLGHFLLILFCPDLITTMRALCHCLHVYVYAASVFLSNIRGIVSF